ncbi:unnamed protein product [Owenia fusiformis]|uniref:Uncharacterized protein n=1 Tax=Owenia fusiformis TaxID=6347 RepID=A0A8J1UPD8_OWEFU|nr:unnamed protein product [Owenia fusiformis]
MAEFTIGVQEFYTLLLMALCVMSCTADKPWCKGTVWKEKDIENLALGKPASQSKSTTLNAGLAVDGVEDGEYYHGSCTHTHMTSGNWWMVDLQDIYPIGSVKLINRKCGESNCRSPQYATYDVEDHLSNFKIKVSKDSKKWELCTYFRSTMESCKKGCQMFYCPSGLKGRYVKVQLQEMNFLSLCEVAVFRPSKIQNLALEKPASQSKSTALDAGLAVDGVEDGEYYHGSCTHTWQTSDIWWMVDLQDVYPIGSVKLINR